MQLECMVYIWKIASDLGLQRASVRSALECQRRENSGSKHLSPILWLTKALLRGWRAYWHGRGLTGPLQVHVSHPQDERGEGQPATGTERQLVATPWFGIQAHTSVMQHSEEHWGSCSYIQSKVFKGNRFLPPGSLVAFE